MTKHKILLISILLSFVLILNSSYAVYAQRCFYISDHSTPNLTYNANLRTVLSSLPSRVTANNNYAMTSFGQAPNTAYALGMCIPGTNPNNCSICINLASNWLLNICSNQTEGLAWLGNKDLCMVRYSNRSFFGLLELEPSSIVYNNNTVGFKMNLRDFDNAWDNLMSRLIDEATLPSKQTYFGAGVEKFGSSRNIYGFMQCSKDLSPWRCYSCLQQSVDDYRSCCRGKQGGIIERPSCFMRWDLYPFFYVFDNTTSPITSNDRKISIGAIVAMSVVPTFVITVLFAIGFIVCKKRITNQETATENDYISFARRSRTSYVAAKQDDGAADYIITSSSLQFDFKVIEAATNQFQKSNKIGQGGFGEVYKGTFPNGTEVAVKRLSKTSGQGEQEFKNEVLLVAKLQHRNLVRLVGYSVQGEEKILVYEFVPNKSLDYFLFDPIKRRQLNWTRRYNIIGGITRGILYLHHDSRLTIIHRDLKASNILLDEHMNPKISDFGMARNFKVDQTEDNTRRVVGTFGYMPPEYVSNGQFSMKSDVYSFGVLILEIIGGKKNSSYHLIDGSVGNLVTYVWRLWNNKSLLELVDQEIGENYDKDEVIRCIHIGLLCVQENPANRPTMASIFQMLTNTYIVLPKPKAPGFFFRVRPRTDPIAEELQAGQSTNECVSYSINNASFTSLSPR